MFMILMILSIKIQTFPNTSDMSFQNKMNSVLSFLSVLGFLLVTYLSLLLLTYYVIAPQEHERLARQVIDPDVPPLDHGVVIYGMVKDGMPGLRRSLENVLDIAAMYQDYRVVILENDSTDKSREVLDELASKDPRVRIVDGDAELAQKAVEQYSRSNYARSPWRISRIAAFRNQLHKEAVKVAAEEFPDDAGRIHFVSVDLDQHRTINMCEFQAAVNKQSETPDTIVASSALGRTISPWIPLHTFSYDSFAFLKTDDKPGENEVYFYMPGAKLKPGYKVQSNFGGVAVYSDSQAFRDNFYEVDLLQADHSVCEHVGFHARLFADEGGTKVPKEHVIGFDTFFH